MKTIVEVEKPIKNYYILPETADEWKALNEKHKFHQYVAATVGFLGGLACGLAGILIYLM